MKVNKAKAQKYEQMLDEQSRVTTFTPGAITIPPGPRLGIIILVLFF